MKVAQYGDRMARARDGVPTELAAYTGPIARHHYAQLTDDELAIEIKRRFVVKKMQMAERILLDIRLLRWFDPERLQDHWQNVYTGRALPKMFHTRGLSVNIYNRTRPISEAGVGLLAGGKPRPYDIDVRPDDENSDADREQADIAEKYCYRVHKYSRYQVKFVMGMSDLWLLGRRWVQATTDPMTRLMDIRHLWPGSVAAFWQSDQITLEQVITQTKMTLSEAVEKYATTPEQRAKIESALQTPIPWGSSQSVSGERSKHKDPTVSVLTSQHRLPGREMGMAVVLLDPRKTNEAEQSAVTLYRSDDTGYNDIPLRCTPRFKIPDKPLDESVGVLFPLAALNTEYNELVSARHDMLWRAIYQRYKAKGFVRPPKLLKGTNIYAMRSDQDIQQLDDTSNTLPIEQAVEHIEEQMLIEGALNRYFLDQGPSGEASGEAITAAVNASIMRTETTRTWIQDDEQWLWEQVIAQGAEFGEFTLPDGSKFPLSLLLEGEHAVEIGWHDVTPKDAVKAKQLALAGLRAGVLSLDSAQNEWRILSKSDEQRKIKRERQSPIWHPEVVSQTAAALIARAQALQAVRQAEALPTNVGAQAKEMATTAAAQGAPPSFESDGPTGGPATAPGDMANPSGRQ